MNGGKIMKAIWCIVLLVLALSSVSVDIMAQDFKGLRERAEKTVKSKNST